MGRAEAEAATGVLGAAGGLLVVLAVVAAAAAAAAHPRRMDRGTWGLHPGPPPQSHGSAQKCPSWGRAGLPAAQPPTPKPPSFQRCPQRKPGIQAPPPHRHLEMRAFFSCMARKTIPSHLSKLHRRLHSLYATQCPWHRTRGSLRSSSCLGSHGL